MGKNTAVPWIFDPDMAQGTDLPSDIAIAVRPASEEDIIDLLFNAGILFLTSAIGAI